MSATVVIDRNPFYHGLDREIITVRRRRRLRSLAPRTDLPYIMLLNGRAVTVSGADSGALAPSAVLA
jgi:hypothetical protein